MKPEAYAMLILCGLVAGFVVLDRAGLWMERRGWIYWRKRKPGEGRAGGGPAAGLLTGFQQIIEPRVEYRIQVMEERNESIGQRLGGRRDDIDADKGSVPAPPQPPNVTPTRQDTREPRRPGARVPRRAGSSPAPAARPAVTVPTQPK